MSTKIHAVVDGLGNLIRFRLTGGEQHDITEAANLIEGMQNVSAVVADKAFDANSLLEVIAAMKAAAVIPPKANRVEPRCLVPRCTGVIYSQLRRDKLWDRYYTGAPAQQRQCVERYSIVKRA